MNQVLKSIIAKQRKDFEALCADRTVPKSAWEGVSVFHNLQYPDKYAAKLGTFVISKLMLIK